MKIYKNIFGLTLLTMTFAACQSNSFKIAGEAEGLADGDTLYLTADMENGIPSDTIIVKNGKFNYTGIADSTYFCLIYSPSDKCEPLPFFVEPATISIHLSKTPGSSKVSGTKINEDFQALNDSAYQMSLKFLAMSEKYGNDVTDEQRLEIENQIIQEQQKITNQLYKTAERNIDNELGYLITTSGVDFSPEQILILINKMPKQFRERPLIKEIEYQIKNMPPEEEAVDSLTETHIDL